MKKSVAITNALFQVSILSLICFLVLLVVGSVRIVDGSIAWGPQAENSAEGRINQGESPRLFTVKVHGKDMNIFEALSRYSFESLIILIPSLVATFCFSLAYVGLTTGRAGETRSAPLFFLSVLPVFLVAYLLQVAAIRLNGFLPGPLVRVAYGGGARRAMLLPWLSLSLVLFFFAARTMQIDTKKIRKMDFVTFASSLGHSNQSVVIRQILPGTVTLFRRGLSSYVQVAFFNLFVIERVFNVPGLSRLLFGAAITYQSRTYFVTETLVTGEPSMGVITEQWFDIQYGLIIGILASIAATFVLSYIAVRLFLELTKRVLADE